MKNALARSVPEIFDGSHGAFREELWQGAVGNSIPIEDYGLYEPRRRLTSGIELRPHEKEEALFKSLLDGSSMRGKMLLLTAPRGTGKTTFLHYFFSKYVDQHMSRACKAGFTELVMLSRSLKRGSASRITRDLWAGIASQISSRFKDIEKENKYKMWSREYPWDDGTHVDAMGTQAPEKYRASVIHGDRPSRFVFCREALRYLHETRTGYIFVLFIDDIDHLPPKAIFEIVQDLREICFETKIAVILPMRPETRQYLVHKGVANDDSASELTLGVAAEAGVMARRAKYAKRRLLNLERDAWDLVPLDDRGDGHSFLPINPVDARRRTELLITEMINESDSESKYAWSVLRGVVGGSIRGMIRVRRRLAVSESWYQHVVEMDRSKMSNYDILRGVLCGGEEEFTGKQHDCDISEVYSLGGADIWDRRLLAGPLLLQLLAKGEASQRVIEKKLARFEIPLSWTRQLIDNLDSLGVVHCFGTYMEVEEEMVSSYQQLIVHPAYVDCIAKRICRAVPVASRSVRARSALSESGSEHPGDSLDLRLRFAIEFFHMLEREWEVISRGRDVQKIISAIGLKNPALAAIKAYQKRVSASQVNSLVHDRPLLQEFLRWNKGRNAL